MAKSESRLGRSFSALAYSGYRRFALSLLLTSLGTQLLQVAILWHVHEITGSALALGLTGLARAGPHILLSLLGGVAADRFDRVRLIQAGQVINAGLVSTLAGLTLAGSVELWHLYLITVLNGGFSALTQPGRTAIIPSLVPQHSLVNAIALNATIGQTSQIVGPAFAGVAIGFFGLGAVYVVNGTFYFLAMLALFAISVPPPTDRTTASPWFSFKEGLTFVRGKPVILSLLSIDMAATILGSYRALLPIFATSLRVGAGGFGLLSAAPGVGSLIGSGIMLSLGDMRYKGFYAVIAVLGYCGALVLLALSPWFAGALVAAALLGTTDSIQMIARNSTIIAITPNVLRGRVEAFRSMVSGGGPPLGYAMSGGFASLFGASVALLIGAGACVAVIVSIAASRRELRDPALGSMQFDPPAPGPASGAAGP
jgi:MFS family permease